MFRSRFCNATVCSQKPGALTINRLLDIKGDFNYYTPRAVSEEGVNSFDGPYVIALVREVFGTVDWGGIAGCVFTEGTSWLLVLLIAKFFGLTSNDVGALGDLYHLSMRWWSQ